MLAFEQWMKDPDGGNVKKDTPAIYSNALLMILWELDDALGSKALAEIASHGHKTSFARKSMDNLRSALAKLQEFRRNK